MNLSKFKELTKKFESRNYEHDNKYIDQTLYYSSWFGNLLSVIFAFFFVNSLVSQAAVHFAGQDIVLPIFIILFLTMFELLKRFVFGNVTITILVAKKITGKIVAGILFTSILVIGSFYLSMSGAQHYVNKTEVITANTDSIINSQVDSLNAYSAIEIKKIEAKIAYVYEAAQTRKRITLTRDEVKDVKQWEQDIKGIKQERDQEVEQVKNNVDLKQDKQLAKSSKSQFAFLLLSGFIELLILCGVGFRNYYSFTSFKQTKEVLDDNPNFKKLESYQTMLQVLYNNCKIKINTPLPGLSKFQELLNARTRVKMSPTYVKEFFNVMGHLNIIQVSKKVKYTNMSYEQACEVLNNYIVLDNE